MKIIKCCPHCDREFELTKKSTFLMHFGHSYPFALYCPHCDRDFPLELTKEELIFLTDIQVKNESD